MNITRKEVLKPQHIFSNIPHNKVKTEVTMYLDGFGGLVVSMLASGTQVCGFKPGRSRWIFRA